LIYFSPKGDNDLFSIKVCASEDNSTKQTECYENIFKDNEETSLCENMIQEHLKFNCFKNLAVNTNQPQLCEKAYQRHYCYVDVAVALKNESICDYAEGFAYYGGRDNFQTEKERCLLLIENS